MARKDPRIEAAEEELIDCMRMLRRLPDPEHGWLHHSTLRWPAMIRDQGDYPDGDEPLRPLSRGELRRVEAMFLAPQCHVGAIAARDHGLVAKVAMIKASSHGGFGWDDVWNALGGKLPTGARDSVGQPVLRKVTSDAMRMRYTRALDALAARLDTFNAAGVESTGQAA